ncbi:MAG: SAM-dependent methyltransferase [Pseudomonadales bacterium]|nr:SAM-dependent methyltransferase [Pseudomonadales bacterium]
MDLFTLRKLRQLSVSFVVIGLLGACTTTTGGSSTVPSAELPARPEADVARDDGRKPFAVLDFLGVEPGMKVVDVLASSGYYTEALAHAVGPEGTVYAQNPAILLRLFGGRNDKALNARLMGNRLSNVRRLDREFDDLGLVAGSIDVAVTTLNFHDLYNRDPEQAAGMLAVLKGVLKPGGVLGIIDHNSNDGADHATLHRMPVSDAIAAAEAAGFTVETSDVLANPEDDRTQGPFTEGLRGYTDRFVLKLTKPE